MKILQINSTVNYGSTGSIAENIGQFVIDNNGQSIIAYGRYGDKSKSDVIKIGTKLDQAFHLIHTRIFDTHGFHSNDATLSLISVIEKINPDLIHLHNIHGYYLNVQILFDFLKKFGKPIVWTLHDCWAYTGHCSHYVRAKCEKWKEQCYECPLQHLYPESKILDNSKSNYLIKKEVFNGVKDLTITTVSKWLESQVKMSFLKEYPIHTVYNGIDTSVFKPNNQKQLKEKLGYDDKKIVLGVANEWSKGKGLEVFREIGLLMDQKTVIILIGLNKNQIISLPSNIIGICRTNNVSELVDYYAMADVFVTPSIAETFGMVVAEALSCGTPCIVNNSTALPELIDESVGLVVSGEANEYAEAIKTILNKGKESFSYPIAQRAKLFDIDLQLRNYYQLYQELISK